MAAFELNENAIAVSPIAPLDVNSSDRRQKIEDIIALKIYDICRGQDCLEFSLIGPARADEAVTIDGRVVNEGEVVLPPLKAASVAMENPHISRIIIVDKSENSFRRGYWDIDIRYIICYRLIFRNACGDVIGCIRASSVFDRKVTLFGSESSEVFSTSDLCCQMGANNCEPYVMVDAKVIGLTASLYYECGAPRTGAFTSPGSPMAVEVTLGLFSVVKLFRVVDLTVESRGFTVPNNNCDSVPMDACSYFDKLDFPMDIFSPPQKPEFLAGISGNIPADTAALKKDGCGCEEVKSK